MNYYFGVTNVTTTVEDALSKGKFDGPESAAVLEVLSSVDLKGLLEALNAVQVQSTTQNSLSDSMSFATQATQTLSTWSGSAGAKLLDCSTFVMEQGFCLPENLAALVSRANWTISCCWPYVHMRLLERRTSVRR